VRSILQTPAWSWPAIQRTARAQVLDGAPLERVLRVVTAAVVVCGVWLRSRGFIYHTISFWLDEATWAIRLMDLPLAEQLIRPIGFMFVSRGLARIFGPSETVLRLMPWCAGIATTMLAPALSRRLFQSAAARLLFVSVLAFHPAAIDLSKEFKPYSVSLGLHFGLLLLALRYCESGKPRDLAYALALAVVSVLFAQDVVFAYPGFFLVLAIAALSSRRLRHLAAIAGVASLTSGVVIGLYIWMWSKMSGDEKAWGKKYDTFYLPNKAKRDRVDWTVAHYAELAATPGDRRGLWKSRRISEDRLAELRSVDPIVWIFLHIAGVTLLIRTRRYRDPLLLVTPGVLMTAFNVYGFWPLGDFRSNLFELLYVTAIAAAAFDRAAKRTRLEDFLPATVLVFAPLFMFERTWNAKKETQSGMAYFPEVMQQLLRLSGSEFNGRQEKLFADSYSCKPLRYYTAYHPKYSEGIGAKIRQRMRLTCSGIAPRAVIQDAAKELRSAPRAWIVATKGKVINYVEKSFPDSLEKAMTVRIGGGQHLIVAVEAKPEPAPEATPETPVPPESPESDAESHSAEP
jgi:hypothetical protein